MKSAFPLIFLLHLTVTSFPQGHADVWLIGRTSSPNEAIQINFTQMPPTLSTIPTGIYLGGGTHSSVCDENGELLIYTNGIKIVDRYGTLLENGDSINAGYAANAYPLGYPIPQGAFFLQRPEFKDEYYLFHIFFELTGGAVPNTRFYYSLIDMAENGGLGKIIEKNVPLISGNHLLNYNQATTTRHANGRDWWIIVPNHMGPDYYRFLLTPNGIEGPWEQEIGIKEPTDDWWDYSNGQRVFSADGSRFVDCDFLNYTQIFEFDRCTGLLSNPVVIDHQIDPVFNNQAVSIAISPSGRFLYMTRRPNNGYSLFQYDLESDDIISSEIEIDHCPIINQQWDCTFADMLLTPDGKIYISGEDSISCHVIHEPDNVGLGSNFERNGQIFPASFPNGIYPYFPNYRLGPLEGSVCDSLVSRNGEVAVKGYGFNISPNPSSGSVLFEYHIPENKPGVLVISHISGKEVARILLNSPVNQRAISDFSSGVYLVTLLIDNEVLQSEKMIVQ